MAVYAAVLIGGAAVTGCGDDGASTAKEEGSEGVAFSAGSEPPKTFVERTARLLQTTKTKRDCATLEGINSHSLTRFHCPAPKQLRESMASFKMLAAEEYGTGAVVDYRSGEVDDGASILLFVAPDRRWGIVTPPSTETSDEDSRAGYEETVDAYLAAVRERDCDAFTEVVFVGSGSGDVCKTIFAGTKDLARRLRADRSTKLRYLGGNSTYGFYSIETETPPILVNTTISIIKAPARSPKPYMVLDAAPSVTTEEQERVRKAYEIQQKEKKTPGMQPEGSTKPLDQDDDN